MTDLKPIIVHGDENTPNPKKVRVILNELGLPWKDQTLNLRTGEHKQPAYLKLNPNGRLPTIEDPNTGITLWESGAIIKYLIEKYDKDNKLSYSTSPEKYQCEQWLFFQASGQGPYFGQIAWFDRYHHEKLPSAIERYQKEAERVIGVLDGALKEKEWLVGDKCTYADLSFVSWNFIVANYPTMNQEGKLFEGGKYPHYTAWYNRMLERPGLKAIVGAGMG